jgi:hypothetical protein
MKSQSTKPRLSQPRLTLALGLSDGHRGPTILGIQDGPSNLRKSAGCRSVAVRGTCRTKATALPLATNPKAQRLGEANSSHRVK